MGPLKILGLNAARAVPRRPPFLARSRRVPPHAPALYYALHY